MKWHGAQPRTATQHQAIMDTIQPYLVGVELAGRGKLKMFKRKGASMGPSVAK